MDSIAQPLFDLPYAVQAVIVLVFAYLFGAIPFSFIIGKVFFRINLFQKGSGNLGAANTFRVLGAPAGIATLLLDMTKGAVAIYAARFIVDGSGMGAAAGNWLLAGCALAVIVGHTASPYIKFRGGKGAASSAGVMFALVPIVFWISFVIFVSTIAITRYVSVGTLAVAFTFPIWMAIFYGNLPFILFGVLIAVIVPWLHKGNIQRLRAGTERRFAWKNRGEGLRKDEADNGSA
ncbi:MAG: glycerol-3-phosphate 1-O-acyltransferase PlsY [Coriobacteriia bacterium]|nr:glycerol-3-phosphate 1-O-acyltransferase PlsY [Coriobacteriia bacterium]